MGSEATRRANLNRLRNGFLELFVLKITNFWAEFICIYQGVHEDNLRKIVCRGPTHYRTISRKQSLFSMTM